jgi:hypothetical protein
VCCLADALGQRLLEENDEQVSLLGRALEHLAATASYSVYYGEGRDSYDEWGRTAHESVFNPVDGRYRCPNSQQGYSGFTTWTRGLAWAMLGFAEELEFLRALDPVVLEPFGGLGRWEALMLKAARATCDWFIVNTPSDGIPYWDGGAPGLHRMGHWRSRPADPFNEHEPVDSSAAAIAAQGLLRLGRHLGGDSVDGRRYWNAGVCVLATLLGEPYLSTNPRHQGLLLHSVYHRANGWDYIPGGRTVPCGESSMWGDYHLREAALLLQRSIEGSCTILRLPAPRGLLTLTTMEDTAANPAQRPPPVCIHSITTKPWPIETAPRAMPPRASGASRLAGRLQGRDVASVARLLRDQGFLWCRCAAAGSSRRRASRTAATPLTRTGRHRRGACVGHAPPVLVCGARPRLALEEARKHIREGIEAVLPDCESSGVKLAVEPLHPMYRTPARPSTRCARPTTSARRSARPS